MGRWQNPTFAPGPSPFSPEISGDYYEPFLGGGSVLLSIIPRVKGTVYASDLNPTLIALYVHVRDSPDAFMSEVDTHVQKEYYALRGNSIL
jgi:DNA adenine methylase